MPTWKLGAAALFAVMLGAAYQLGHPLTACACGIGLGLLIADPNPWGEP